MGSSDIAAADGVSGFPSTLSSDSLTGNATAAVATIMAAAATPSPVEFEALSATDSADLNLTALELTAGYLASSVAETVAASEDPIIVRAPEDPVVWKCPRPGRLQAAVPDSAEMTFTGSKHRGLIKAEASELPAFRYLAALEEAVHSGEALAGRLPEMPTALSARDADIQRCAQPACLPDSPASARGLPRGRPAPSASLPLRTCGGLLAKAPTDRPSANTRFLFSDEGWGMQAPSLPGARKHAAASGTALRYSALRGAPLAHCRRGPHASALWVNTEKARLRTEVVKPFGCSAAIAFIQNGGPKSLESLQQGLCDRELM